MSWQAAEYAHYERTADWYWWVGLVAVIMLGLAVWQKSFLFGVLVLVAWFTILLYAVRPPRTIQVAITEHGVMVEKNLYLWGNLKSFWIFYTPPIKKEVSLETKKSFVTYVKIPLGDMDPEEVKTIIKKFIPEIEQRESLIDNLSHLAKF